MKNVKAKAITIVMLAFLFGSAFMQVTAYNTNEDNLLAKLKPADILPDMMLIANATLTIESVTGRGNVIQSIRTVTAEIPFPVLAESDEDSEKIALTPEAEEQAILDSWGIPQLAGEKTYLVENNTDAVITNYNVTNDFSVETYPYLMLEGAYSRAGTEAATLVVSFSSTAGGSWESNKTIINGQVLPIGYNMWYNLAAETSVSYPYIVNINVINLDIDGHFIFRFESNKMVLDDRYDVTYIDLDGTQLVSAASANGIIGDTPVLALYGDSSVCDFRLHASTVEDLNRTTMLNVPSRIEGRDDMYLRAVGWLTGQALEDDLKAAWREQLILQGLIDANDRIVSYNMSHAFWKTTINQGLVKMIKRGLTEQIQKTTDYRSLIHNVMGATMPLCTIGNEKETFDHFKRLVDFGLPIKTDTFWDTIKDGFKSIGSSITTIASKIIDAPAKLVSSLGDAAGNIIKPIGQTIQGVIPHATNMIKDSLGHVTGGIVGVAGAAKDLGSNIMDSLKLPLIIVGGVLGVGVVIFLIIKFGKGGFGG